MCGMFMVLLPVAFKIFRPHTNIQTTDVFLLATEQLWFLFQFKIHSLTLEWFSIECFKTETKPIA